MLNKIKAFFVTANEKVASCVPAVLGGSAAVGSLALTTFASGSGGGIQVTTAVTTEMISPLVDLVIANIAAIMPAGIAIFGVMFGVRLVPRIIHSLAG